MRLNPKKTKSMMVSQSPTYAPGYGDLIRGNAELEEIQCLRILVVILNSKLAFETHFREVVSQTAKSLGVRKVIRLEQES